jgi:hypothetical protein
MNGEDAYPSPATWEYANARQRARAERSFAILKRRAVPVFPGPLFVEDDEECILQAASEVARRVLVLSGIVMHAEGVSYDNLDMLFQEQQLWPSVSPKEAEFLRDYDPPIEQRRSFSWRWECIVVLLWALGYCKNLDWPWQQCDAKKLATLLVMLSSSPRFIRDAKLRSVPEILDAQDLILRIHWAVRHSYLNGYSMPVDLDWSGDSEWMAAPYCEAFDIVQEQHHAINWLTMGGESTDWDNVDTST